MDALHFENISFAYDNRPFSLSNVSCRIPGGSFTALLGPNGAGKTTLFRLACGILTPSAGRILINGADIR
jgi:ABC-type bacteriocin/lantibiotic exporter with double-glycine peptidase domain